MEARVAKYKARKSDWKKSAGQIKDLNQRVAELQAQVREAQSHTDSEHARFSQLQVRLLRLPFRDYVTLTWGLLFRRTTPNCGIHMLCRLPTKSLWRRRFAYVGLVMFAGVGVSRTSLDTQILEAQQRDNAAMHQEELKKFGEQVANAKSENREMMIRLQERDTTIDTLKHELEEARARIQQLEQDLSTAQAQQRAADEAVRSRIDGAEARVKELEGTIEQLYRERDDAQSRLSQLQSERDLWQEQRSQHERKISESVERQQQMALEIKSLRDELTRFVTVSPAVEGGEEQGMQERPTSPPVPSKFAFEQSLRGSAK
jgi:chromosome segregation ATPase